MSDLIHDFWWLIFSLFGMVMAAREVSSDAGRGRRHFSRRVGDVERGQ